LRVDFLAQVATSKGRLRDAAPAWSPDGQTIAFARHDQWWGSLYRIDHHGGDLRRLTEGTITSAEHQIYAIDWAPSGNTIAYTRLHLYEDFQNQDNSTFLLKVHLISPEGGDDRVIWETPAEFYDICWGVSWAPNGHAIALAFDTFVPVRENEHRGRVVLLRIVGAGVDVADLPAETREAIVGGPAWSPDGAMIAFLSQPRTGGLPTLELMSPDGSRRRTILSENGLSHPVWSPDGTYILFQVADGGLATIRPDGSDYTRLPFPFSGWEPDWGVSDQRGFQPKFTFTWPSLRRPLRGADAGTPMFFDPLWDPPLFARSAAVGFLAGVTLGYWVGRRRIKRA
jgi:Tol biopolymer transport system component